LTDPQRCQVALVTLPEEMPVNEAAEAAYKLEDRVGVSLGPVIVNGCLPRASGLHEEVSAAAAAAGADISEELAGALSAAAHFTTKRTEEQNAQLKRLSDELPLRQIRVPAIPSEAIGPDELAIISEALRVGIKALPEPQPEES
jgi:anion-transporting  ArsA/GET3 family ATPase